MSTNPTVLAVDLGGTTVKAGLVSAAGDILYQNNLPTLPDQGPDIVIGQIEAALRNVIEKGAFPLRSAIGIGSPGVVNEAGVVKAPPNLKGWDEVPLAEELSKRFRGFTVVVENDANVAAIAESKFGAGRDHANFLFVIWGTGVGGGIILNNLIYRGPTGGAGEIGHISIDHKGPACNCGGTGCIEAYIGQRYLSQRTVEKLSEGASSSLPDLVSGDLSKIEPVYIAKAAQSGDSFSKGVLVEAGTLLGVAIAAVMNTLDLRISIIGGGVSAAGDFVLEAIEESVRCHVLKPLRPDIRVLEATQGNAAGLLGAAGLVL